MYNALSVDVEDWFQVGAFENVISRDHWDACECRVERNTDRLLAMFDEAGIKATFFTLGWVAERYPALIRRIADAGHELGNHGQNHDRVFTFAPAQFAADLDRSRKAIEDAGGVAVKGYRAPSFSINPDTPWAHEMVGRAGLCLFVEHKPDRARSLWLGGCAALCLPPHRGQRFCGISGDHGDAGIEADCGGRRRFFPPAALCLFALGGAPGQCGGAPGIIYFHPWEINPDRPRVANAPLKSKLRHYTRLEAMAGKLRRLIADFRWDRLDRIVEQEKARLA